MVDFPNHGFSVQNAKSDFPDQTATLGIWGELANAPALQRAMWIIGLQLDLRLFDQVSLSL